MYITSAREQLKQSKDQFKLPLNFNLEEFREVANGFFQAEGHVSCRIRGKYFTPVVAITQNFSLKSLEFFLTLWHVLGRTSTLNLIKNKQGKLVIRLSSESWDIILNLYSKFFNRIYGEKYIAFQKLSDIRRLTSNSSGLNSSTLALATYILYDLSPDGLDRKYSLSEQLKLFGISNENVELPNYTENNASISILFIIGFILGDGTLHLRLRNSDKGSIWIIPTLFLPQLKSKYNAHFFSILEDFFESLDIKTYTINKIKDTETMDILIETSFKENIKGMTVLTVESIHSISDKLIPIFNPYSQYFYWKYTQYELMFRLTRLINAKAHYTLYGFSTMLDIIYSYPNSRIKSKEYWLDLIQSWFQTQASKNKSGENNIQAVYGRGSLKGEIVAWKCVFPIESKIKSRQFGFTNNIESREALNQAIIYRDTSIKSWIDSLK